MKLKASDDGTACLLVELEQQAKIHQRNRD